MSIKRMQETAEVIDESSQGDGQTQLKGVHRPEELRPGRVSSAMSCVPMQEDVFGCFSKFGAITQKTTQGWRHFFNSISTTVGVDGLHDSNKRNTCHGDSCRRVVGGNMSSCQIRIVVAKDIARVFDIEKWKTARFLKSAEDMGHDFGLGSIFLLVVRRFW